MFACGLLLARAAIVTHFVMKWLRGIINLARARDVALQIHVCNFLLQCRAAGGSDGICCSRRKKARENRDAYSSQNNGQCVGASSFQFGGWFDFACIFLRVACLTCCSQFTLAEDYHQKQVAQPFPLLSSGSPCDIRASHQATRRSDMLHMYYLRQNNQLMTAVQPTLLIQITSTSIRGACSVQHRAH